MKTKTTLTLLGTVLLFGIPPAWAQDGIPRGLSTAERINAQQTQAQTAMQARQQIEELFSRLCPGRCEIVEVKVEMADPTPVGEVVPGFETVVGQNFSSDVKAISATVLLDSKLPRNFQANLPRMIRHRLADMAQTVNVRPEVLDFPEPQLEPMPPYLPEPPRRTWEAPPQPEPAPLPAPEPVVEAPVEPPPPPTLWDRLMPILEAIAPWIGPIIMMFVLFGLMMALLRRLQQVSGTNAGGAVDRVRREAQPDVEALLDELNASRGVRNRVLRRWLAEDEDAMARAVRLFGPQIVSDLKSDASLAPALARVSELVAREREPLSADDVKKTATEVQARLTAARIVHDEASLTMDWEFLEGMSPQNVRRILHSCSATEVAYVVGQLPPSLRTTYLESLDADDRRALVLGTSADLLSKEEALALAARLRKAADDVSHIGREADGQAALVLDMLRALQLDEQEEMLRELKAKRAELAQVVLSRLVLETTLLQIPGELAADAIHRTPVELLAAFLRGTRGNVRDHVLAVAPASKRQAVLTELSLDVPVSKADFLAARERFLDVVRDVVTRDGADIVRANTRALMTTSKINPVTDEAAL